MHKIRVAGRGCRLGRTNIFAHDMLADMRTQEDARLPFGLVQRQRNVAASCSGGGVQVGRHGNETGAVGTAQQHRRQEAQAAGEREASEDETDAGIDGARCEAAPARVTHGDDDGDDGWDEQGWDPPQQPAEDVGTRRETERERIISTALAKNLSLAAAKKGKAGVAASGVEGVPGSESVAKHTGAGGQPSTKVKKTKQPKPGTKAWQAAKLKATSQGDASAAPTAHADKAPRRRSKAKEDEAESNKVDSYDEDEDDW